MAKSLTEWEVPDLKVDGLTGATAVARFVGCTASGPPTSGTFAVGDFIVTQAGGMWVCTSAGSPGTWTRPGTRSVADVHTDASVVNSTTETTLASLAIPTTARVGDLYRLVFAGDMLNNTGSNVTCQFRFYIGATVALSTIAANITTSTNRRQWRADATILVVAAATDQRVNGFISASFGSTVSWPLAAGNNTFLAPGRGTAAEDLTAGKNAAISVQLGTANASADCYLHEATLEEVRRG